MAKSQVTAKRKHFTISLKIKNYILVRLEKGDSITNLSKEFNVGRATIYDLKKIPIK